MEKQKTAMQSLIEKLEASIKDIDPRYRTHHAVSTIISVAKLYLTEEQRQIEQAAITMGIIVLGGNTPDLKDIAHDYFTETYEQI